MFSLIDEVEQQGGSHTNEQCAPRPLKYGNQPPNITNFDDKTPRVTKIVGSTGCKRHYKFLVPLLDDEIVARILPEDSTVAIQTDEPDVFEYRDLDFDDFDFDDAENHESLSITGRPIPATVCAIDDAMGMWPRFQSAMFTGESYMVP